MSLRRRGRPRQFKRAAGAFALGLGVTIAVCLPFFSWLPRPTIDPDDRSGWSELPSQPMDAEPPAPSRAAVTLAFVGDIRMPAAAPLHPVSAPAPWQEIRGALAGADLGIGNLETTLSSTGEAARKRYTFRSPPELVRQARSAGIGLLSLGNNHALDFGRTAMLETVRTVRAGGVLTVGAGADATEAYAPVLLQLRGTRIGFLSFSRVLPDRSWAATADRAGVASGYSSTRVMAAIDSLKGRVDEVVVLMHWGSEARDTPRTADRMLADEMIRHGASAVIGHHPHVLQGVEWSRGSFIAYSLGNLLFPGSRRVDTGVLLLTLRKGDGVIAARFVPLRLTGGSPRRATAVEAGEALSRFDATVASAGLAVASDGEILARGPSAQVPSEHGVGGTH